MSHKIIMQQIGNKALYMLGAKKFSYDCSKNTNLSFRIMRNAKKVNHIEITLNSMDLYDIKFNRNFMANDGLTYHPI